MQRYGPAWCRCTGTLKNWSCVHLLPLIRACTLVLNGTCEQAQDFVIGPFLELVNDHKAFKFKQASNLPQYEEHDECMRIVSNFLLHKKLTYKPKPSS